MAATTTRSINSIRKRILADHPQFSFKQAAHARWSWNEQTIYYNAALTPGALTEMVHELGHALLGHKMYTQDIELLQMERDAWSAAYALCEHYDIEFNDEDAEKALDTYRDWLHARSRCVQCSAAGVQSLEGEYRCVLCNTRWRANEAKSCGLKRYQQK